MAVIVTAVFLSQALFFSILAMEANSKIEQFEQTFVFDRIATVFRDTRDASAADRQRILVAQSSPEVVFNLMSRTEGRSPDIDGPFGRLLELMPGPVSVLEQPVRLRDALVFWFNDETENCFLTRMDDPVQMECPYWQISVQFPDGTWLAATGQPLPEAYLILAPVFLSALMSLLGITLVVALLTRHLTAPLRLLSDAAEKIGRGGSVAALPETGPKELVSVLSAFNVMQERLTRFVHDRTTMLASVGHDLRTPITSLRLRAEFVDDDALKDHIVASLDDMQAMVDSFLTFSRQDVSEERDQDFDLVKLCERLAEHTSGMTFSTDQVSCVVRGRKIALQRALSNLIDNAIKYGKVARVSLSSGEGAVSLTIDDRGNGVPENMFEEIFSPFVRLDQARSVVQGSVGLGLSIARSIVRKHGGDVVPRKLSDGFRMHVTIPGSARIDRGT